MNVPFVDLLAQYKNIKSEVDNAISDVLDKTAFIGGDVVASFSRNFEDHYGVEHCVPCANGTDALYIVMRMLGIGPGDEVITTSSTWISTSETISQTGATPVFIDIDQYYTINVDLIESKITPKTKAIIPVHLYGQMANMPLLMDLAKRHNLKVIEDCAQSHFSKLNGKSAGLWGDAATFSFYPGKNLGAYGDAGCIITNNETLALECKKFANHGSLTKHKHEIEGINSRMDGLQAAVLNVKLGYIDLWTQRRREAAELYFKCLEGVSEIELPKVRPNSIHTFHVFGIKTTKRDALKEFLKSQGVSTQIHYPKAIPFVLAYKSMQATPADFPNSYRLQEEELSLPLYPELTQGEIDYVCKKIIEFFR